ncbi:MAG TPA: POTRA domain-containing protein, partial [Terracidiphilus sp.]
MAGNLLVSTHMLPRVACALMFLLANAGFRLVAQVTEFEGARIVDIQYSPVQPLDPADLAVAQPLKQGDLLHSSEVASAIDGLFATGRFQNITVEAESAPGGVLVRFVTEPQWFIGGVAIEGKAPLPPNQAELRGTAQLSLGKPFHQQDITQAVDSMTRMLKSNGFYQGIIEPRVERSPDAQQVFITFEIKPGKRAKYEMPNIRGDAMLSDSTILRVTGWRLPIIH